jgi:hypothetical protein
MDFNDLITLGSGMKLNTMTPDAFKKLETSMVGAGITNPATDFNDVAQLANLARSISMSKNTNQSKHGMDIMAALKHTVFSTYAAK